MVYESDLFDIEMAVAVLFGMYDQFSRFVNPLDGAGKGFAVGRFEPGGFLQFV